MAARCKEAGQMADSGILVELVTQLQGAAAWVEAALPEAQLVASPTAAIERELLGRQLEQAAATPMISADSGGKFCATASKSRNITHHADDRCQRRTSRPELDQRSFVGFAGRCG